MNDARTLKDGTLLSADICVIGTGPAATTFLQEFAGSDLSIVVLTSGGMNTDANDHGQLASGFKFGNATDIANEQRIGGNSYRWNGRTSKNPRNLRLTEFLPEDFEPRPGLSEQGWPIRFADVSDYLARAAKSWGLPDKGFKWSRFAEPAGGGLDFGPDIEKKVYQFAPASTIFETHIRTIEQAENIRLISHAIATSFDTPGTDQVVRRLNVVAENGRRFGVEAGRFVVATGGMNAVRLLFLSKSQDGHSLGNRHDQLGRGFMEHPMVDGGIFRPASPDFFDKARMFDLHIDASGPAMGYLALSGETLQAEGLPGLCMALYPRNFSDPKLGKTSARRKAGLEAAVRIRARMERRKLPSIFDVFRVLAGMDELIARLWRRYTAVQTSLTRGGWSKVRKPHTKYNGFFVFQHVEQPWRPDNRLLLSNEKDQFGLPRLTIDWRWHDEDKAKVMRSQDLLAKSIEASGIGKFEIKRENGELAVLTDSSYHYLGGTRMGDTPDTSVVDRNCKLHEVDNVFVLSSSVYSTGSFANPTFLLTALAIRLADHLKDCTRGAEAARGEAMSKAEKSGVLITS